MCEKNIKKGDRLLCKKTTMFGNFFPKNSHYIVEDVIYYTTTTVQNPLHINEQPKTFFYVKVNNVEFSNFNFYDYFYTKQEERKLKLNKLINNV